MSIQRIITPLAPEPPPERWSNCLLVDGVAYISGMVALMGDEAALAALDEYDQAKACFAKIRALVEAAGGAMGDVVKITMFVVDIGNGDKIWRARREVFTGNFPASTMVEVRALATPKTLIEIEAIAHIGRGPR